MGSLYRSPPLQTGKKHKNEKNVYVAIMPWLAILVILYFLKQKSAKVIAKIAATVSVRFKTVLHKNVISKIVRERK